MHTMHLATSIVIDDADVAVARSVDWLTYLKYYMRKINIIVLITVLSLHPSVHNVARAAT